MSAQTVELVVIAGSTVVVIAGGIAALIAERRRRGPAAAGALARSGSAASVALAVGVCVLVLGWSVSAWLFALGAGLTAAGLLGVVRGLKGPRRPPR